MTDKAAQSAFSDTERQTMAALANVIIPPSDAHSIPGAGDPDIVEVILGDARSPEKLSAALAALDALADAHSGVAFLALESADQMAVAENFREEGPGDATLVETLTVQAYYRDDRVMASLGLDQRPPHPLGYEVKQGDWSLLDPVRKRARLYRPAE